MNLFLKRNSTESKIFLDAMYTGITILILHGKIKEHFYFWILGLSLLRIMISLYIAILFLLTLLKYIKWHICKVCTFMILTYVYLCNYHYNQSNIQFHHLSKFACVPFVLLSSLHSHLQEGTNMLSVTIQLFAFTRIL